MNRQPTAEEILAWIDANPEAFTRIVVRKESFGRKVWWRTPGGTDCDTLRECIAAAIKDAKKKSLITINRR